MADKLYNITIGNGETVSIPAWAKEETLKKVLIAMQLSADANKAVADEVLNLDNDIDDMIDVLTKSLDEQYKEQRAEEDDNVEKKKYWAELGTSVKNTFDSDSGLDFLKNSANMFNTGIFKPAGDKLSGFALRKFPKIMGGIAKFAGPIGMAANLASDALFAYAGLLTAAYQQQAKLSRSLLNVGGTVDGVSLTMEQLITEVAGTAMSMESFGKLVEDFGPTVAGLGDNVAGGIRPLLGMLDNLQAVSKEYGGFGMGIEERNAEFMTFLENKRLSGALDGGVQGKAQGLVNEFALMQAEITSLATLTGQARSDIFAQRMAALSEPETAAIREGLERVGTEGQKAVFENLVSQTSQIEQALGEAAAPATTLMAATKDALLRANYDMDNINILSSLKDMAPGLATLFADDIVEYQNLLKEGNVDAANGFLFDMFQNMEGIDVAYGIGGNELSDAQKQLNIFQNQLQNFLGQVANETEEERAARLAARETTIKEQMAATGAFNTAGQSFEELKKELASMLIPNLQGLAKGAADFLTGLKDFISWLNPFDDTDEDDAETDAGSTNSDGSPKNGVEVTSDFSYTPNASPSSAGNPDAQDPRNAPTSSTDPDPVVTEVVENNEPEVEETTPATTNLPTEEYEPVEPAEVPSSLTPENAFPVKIGDDIYENMEELQNRLNRAERSLETLRMQDPLTYAETIATVENLRDSLKFAIERREHLPVTPVEEQLPEVRPAEPEVVQPFVPSFSIIPNQDSQESLMQEMIEYLEGKTQEQEKTIEELQVSQAQILESEITRTRAWTQATKTLMRNNRTA